VVGGPAVDGVVGVLEVVEPGVVVVLVGAEVVVVVAPEGSFTTMTAMEVWSATRKIGGMAVAGPPFTE
jgi:hypothetical protein